MAVVVSGAALVLLALSPTLGLLAVGACVLASFEVAKRHRRHRHCDPIESAGRHLELGNLIEAARILVDEEANDARSDYVTAALAVIRLRQGLPSHAVWLLSRSLCSAKHRCGVVEQTLEHALGYAFAVGGALEAAEQCRIGAIGLRESSSPLRILLLCKQQRFEDVADLSVLPDVRDRLVRTGPSALGAELGAHGERVVALLCGFAVDQLTMSDSPTKQRRIDGFLGGARPTHAGEFDYLHEDWPELQAFLVANVNVLGPVVPKRPPLSVPRAQALA